LILIVLNKIGLSDVEAVGVFVILLVIIQVFLEKVLGTNLIHPIRYNNISEDDPSPHGDDGGDGGDGGDESSPSASIAPRLIRLSSPRTSSRVKVFLT